MKNLALLATTAAIFVLPLASANAEDMTHNKNHRNANYEQRVDTINLTPAKPEMQQVFALENSNNAIAIRGEKIYVVEEDGDQYFAPDGSYKTALGVTYFANAGVVSHVEAPQDVIYVNAQDMNQATGIYRNLDVDVVNPINTRFSTNNNK